MTSCSVMFEIANGVWTTSLLEAPSGALLRAQAQDSFEPAPVLHTVVPPGVRSYHSYGKSNAEAANAAMMLAWVASTEHLRRAMTNSRTLDPHGEARPRTMRKNRQFLDACTSVAARPGPCSWCHVDLRRSFALQIQSVLRRSAHALPTSPPHSIDRDEAISQTLVRSLCNRFWPLRCRTAFSKQLEPV